MGWDRARLYGGTDLKAGRFFLFTKILNGIELTSPLSCILFVLLRSIVGLWVPSRGINESWKVGQLWKRPHAWDTLKPFGIIQGGSYQKCLTLKSEFRALRMINDDRRYIVSYLEHTVTDINQWDTGNIYPRWFSDHHKLHIKKKCQLGWWNSPSSFCHSPHFPYRLCP